MSRLQPDSFFEVNQKLKIRPFGIIWRSVQIEIQNFKICINYNDSCVYQRSLNYTQIVSRTTFLALSHPGGENCLSFPVLVLAAAFPDLPLSPSIQRTRKDETPIMLMHHPWVYCPWTRVRAVRVGLPHQCGLVKIITILRNHTHG